MSFDFNGLSNLISVGVGTVAQVIAAVRAGRITVQDETGTTLTADDVTAKFAALGAVIDELEIEAAQRIIARHANDPAPPA